LSDWLLDTGPLVAYLNHLDPFHDAVAAGLDSFRGRLLTTSAVVTEAMHFVSASLEGAGLLADFILSTETRVYDYTQPGKLREAASLMEKYADIPMDFADATLMLLAEDLDVSAIATLDRRGFTVFRTRQRRALEQVLELG